MYDLINSNALRAIKREYSRAMYYHRLMTTCYDRIKFV